MASGNQNVPPKETPLSRARQGGCFQPRWGCDVETDGMLQEASAAHWGHVPTGTEHMAFR